MINSKIVIRPVVECLEIIKNKVCLNVDEGMQYPFKNSVNELNDQEVLNLLQKNDLELDILETISTDSARAVRIRNEFQKTLLDIKDYMINENGFNLPKPNLLISVTCGDTFYKINEETKNAFKIALMKVAKSTITWNSWIITDGIDDNVAQLIGDAVRENLNGNDQTLIGIAPRGSWVNK